MNAEFPKPNTCARCGKQLAVGESCYRCQTPSSSIPQPTQNTEDPTAGLPRLAESSIFTSCLLTGFAFHQIKPITSVVTLVVILLFFSRWQYIRGFLTAVFLVGGIALLIEWVMNPRGGILYGTLLVYAVLTLATLHVHQPVAQGDCITPQVTQQPTS